MAKICYTGQVIGQKYEILDLLGEGGMGAVYLARHKLLGKQVAAKFLHLEIAQKKDVVKRFFREAKAAIEIGHPNVVDILDIGTSQDGAPYMIMEYMDGEALSDLIERTGPLSLGAACGIFEQVLNGLGAAHLKGIVHRDLKPDNIYLAYDITSVPKVKIIDFGISKFTYASKSSQLTLMGDMLGTPAYMAPEQIRGSKNIDVKADIYSFGVIAYEVLTGKRPFGGANYNEIFAAALTEKPPKPEKVYPGFQKEAKSFLMKLLKKRSDDRPENVEEVLGIIKAFSDYPSRHLLLKEACRGFVSKTIVVGDKAASIEEFDDAIDKIRSSPAFEVSNIRTTLLASNRNTIKILVAVCGLLIVTVMTLFVVLPADDNADSTQEAKENIIVQRTSENKEGSAQGTTSAFEDNVRIELREVPPKSKVRYNNMVVPFHTFNAKKQDTIVPIVVTAKGYQTFETSIVPSEDQVISVKMLPTDAVVEPKQSDAKEKAIDTESLEQLVGAAKSPNEDEPDVLENNNSNAQDKPTTKKIDISKKTNSAKPFSKKPKRKRKNVSHNLDGNSLEFSRETK